jgi:Na+-driven multidrug efflux pump
MDVPQNPYLAKPIGPLFTQTALPIIFVIVMYGMTTVIDVVLVGTFVGADVIGALTCVFPILMILLALSTLVGNGMASILAILSLSKPYAFTIPLVILFGALFGRDAIWFASPVAELMLLLVAMLVLRRAGTLSTA